MFKGNLWIRWNRCVCFSLRIDWYQTTPVLKLPIAVQGGNVEKDFATKKYAFMLAGSWLRGEFSPTIKQNFEQQIGMIPMFPVPNRNTQNTTMMGGWELRARNIQE